VTIFDVGGRGTFVPRLNTTRYKCHPTFVPNGLYRLYNRYKWEFPPGINGCFSSSDRATFCQRGNTNVVESCKSTLYVSFLALLELLIIIHGSWPLFKTIYHTSACAGCWCPHLKVLQPQLGASYCCALAP
jgi:hypothetical protein